MVGGGDRDHVRGRDCVRDSGGVGEGGGHVGCGINTIAEVTDIGNSNDSVLMALIRHFQFQIIMQIFQIRNPNLHKFPITKVPSRERGTKRQTRKVQWGWHVSMWILTRRGFKHQGCGQWCHGLSLQDTIVFTLHRRNELGVTRTITLDSN